MIKRFASMFLIVIMLFTSAPIIASAEGENYTTADKFMISLGILKGDDNGYRLDDNITRSEFVTIIIRIIGMEKIKSGDGAQQRFSDVPASYWAFSNIEFAYEMGLINGKNETEFSPEDTISRDEAVKIILNVLGYEVPASTHGGYPSGYNYWGRRLGIFNNTSENAIINRHDMCQMIYNVSDVSLFDNLSNKFEKDDTILSVYLHLKLKEGKVLATHKNNKDALREDQINVSGKVYNLSDACVDSADSFIGEQVRCYVSEDGSNETIYYIVSERTVKETVVNYDDISEETDLSKFVYYDNKGNRKTAKLDENTSYFYNGDFVNFDDLTPSVLKPSSGYVTLKDVNSDGVADIVITSEYVNYVVRYISDNTIYDKYSKTPLKLDDYGDNVRICDKQGQKIELTDIKPGGVASVMNSIDKKSVTIYFTDETFDGEPDYVNGDGEYRIKLSDLNTKEIKLAKNYDEALKANHHEAVKLELGGGTYRFSVDFCGMIADVKVLKEGKSKIYGYLTDCTKESGLKKHTAVEVLTQDNKLTVFELADRVKFGRTVGSEYKVTSEDSETVAKALRPGGSLQRQLIQYNIDSDGRIKEFYIKNESSENSADGFKQYTSQLDMTYRENTLDQKYYLDGNTVVFFAPLNGTYKRLLSAGKYTDYFKNGSTYAIDLFESDDFVPDVVVINHRGINTYESTDDGYEVVIDYVNSPVLYIDKIFTSLAEDEQAYTTVSGYQNGEYVSLYLSNTLNENSESIESLKPGMAIQYETNSIIRQRAETCDEMPQIILYKTVFDFNDTEKYGEDGILWEYVNVESTKAEISTMWGTVADSSTSMMAIKEIGKICSLHGGTTVLSYTQRGGFKLENINEIVDGRRAFIRQRYQNTREVVLY